MRRQLPAHHGPAVVRRVRQGVGQVQAPRVAVRGGRGAPQVGPLAVSERPVPDLPHQGGEVVQV